jgi:hypothetical protein
VVIAATFLTTMPPTRAPDRDDGHRGLDSDRGVALAEYERGKAGVAQSGCWLSKRPTTAITGLGPEFTRACGSRARIARMLVNPTALMPSYKHLPPQKFNAIVNFLSQQK